MGEREIRHFKFGRELIPTTLAESDTCRLLICTDDQIEAMRSFVNYAHRRESWNDETIDSERYYLPSDDDWNTLSALVDDLEWRLMSLCDFVTLDDGNERVGLNQPSPAWGIDALSNDGFSFMDEAEENGLQFYDTEGTFNAADTIVIDAPNIRLYGGKVGVGLLGFTAGGADLEIDNGITFQATQVLFADPHTLDDYEEGSFVCGFECGTSGTITLKNDMKTLAYVKIGRLVCVQGFIRVDSVSAPTGVLQLTGLPFPATAGYPGYAGFGLFAYGLAAGAVTALAGYMVAGTTTAEIFKFGAGAVTALAVDVLADSTFLLGFSYLAAE